MRIVFFLMLSLSLSAGKANAQDDYRDSLRQSLNSTTDSKARANLLFTLGWSFVFLHEDSATYYARQGLELAQQINYRYGEARFCWLLAFSFSLTGNFAGSLEYGLKELQIAETLRDTALLTEANFVLGNGYAA